MSYRQLPAVLGVACVLHVAQPLTANAAEEPILATALEAARNLGAQQSPADAAEISSKRTMGLVKIVIGSLVAVTGVSYLALGGTAATELDDGGGFAAKAVIMGGALGGGGAWLIYSGVQDRADAAAMAAGAPSLNFAPVRGGVSVNFSRAW